MRAVLHQVFSAASLPSCLARCKPGDAVLLLDTLAPQQGSLVWPDDVEVLAVSGLPDMALELQSGVRVIDDDQWVVLVARFPLSISW